MGQDKERRRGVKWGVPFRQAHDPAHVPGNRLSDPTSPGGRALPQGEGRLDGCLLKRDEASIGRGGCSR